MCVGQSARAHPAGRCVKPPGRVRSRGRGGHTDATRDETITRRRGSRVHEKQEQKINDKLPGASLGCATVNGVLALHGYTHVVAVLALAPV